jgi:hypothetical protein
MSNRKRDAFVYVGTWTGSALLHIVEKLEPEEEVA